MTSGRLANALAAIGEAVPPDAGDWWIIGSTAMTLSGIETREPDDVDVLGPARMLLDLLRRWGVEPGEARSSDRFRSHPYARASLPGCTPIETMGDLHVRHGDAWLPVRPRTRIAVAMGRHTFHVPALAEQIEILRLFGRPKDIEKARLIEASL